MQWRRWLVGWLAAIVLAGGVAYVLTAEESPVRPFGDPVVVETTVREVVVLPAGQAEVSGRFDRLEADDAVGPVVPLPLRLPSGRALIDAALVDGERVTISWDGGRPLVLSGTGGIDLGPTRVVVEAGTTTLPLDDGVRVLAPGEYRIDTPVAVGSSGLARPVDGVSFVADEETTVETSGVVLSLPTTPMRLEGPGRLVLVGSFTVRTRDGVRTATRLELPDGPFVVDLQPDGAFSATVRGDLAVS